MRSARQRRSRGGDGAPARGRGRRAAERASRPRRIGVEGEHRTAARPALRRRDRAARRTPLRAARRTRRRGLDRRVVGGACGHPASSRPDSWSRRVDGARSGAVCARARRGRGVQHGAATALVRGRSVRAPAVSRPLASARRPQRIASMTALLSAACAAAARPAARGRRTESRLGGVARRSAPRPTPVGLVGRRHDRARSSRAPAARLARDADQAARSRRTRRPHVGIMRPCISVVETGASRQRRSRAGAPSRGGRRRRRGSGTCVVRVGGAASASSTASGRYSVQSGTRAGRILLREQPRS